MAQEVFLNVFIFFTVCNFFKECRGRSTVCSLPGGSSHPGGRHRVHDGHGVPGDPQTSQVRGQGSGTCTGLKSYQQHVTLTSYVIWQTPEQLRALLKGLRGRLRSELEPATSPMILCVCACRLCVSAVGGLDLTAAGHIRSPVSCSEEADESSEPYTTERLSRLAGGFTALTEPCRVMHIDFNNPQVRSYTAGIQLVTIEIILYNVLYRIYSVTLTTHSSAVSKDC